MRKRKTTILPFIIFFIANSIIFGQLPTINSFTPSSGDPGDIVHIYGSNFKIENNLYKPPADYTSVKFGNYQSFPTSVTSTHIVVPVPNIPTGYYKISVTNQNGRTESSSNFHILPPPPQPITNISYLHGFNSNNSTWSYAKNLFNYEFDIEHSTNVSYDGLASISETASYDYNSLIPYENTVVVAHSMGGVLAREIQRQRGDNSRMTALISVGTPHKGAPVVYLSPMNMGPLLSQWLYDLAYPWSAYFSGQYSLNLANLFLGPIINLVNFAFDPAHLQSATASNLNPYGSFIATLNSNPNATLPPAVYTIYGHEDWYSHWRLADASLNGGVENGEYVQFLFDVLNEYSWQAWSAYDEAFYYLDLFYDYWDYDYLNQYYYWRSIGDAFNYSVYALNTLHQFEWNQYIVGENATNGNCVNDAFIPKWSQAPSFVNNTKHLEALHTNHNEETTRSEAIDRIREALTKDDIDLPR